MKVRWRVEMLPANLANIVIIIIIIKDHGDLFVVIIATIRTLICIASYDVHALARNLMEVCR